MSAQTTSHILMVRPANFGFNEETAQNNSFQSKDQSLTIEEVKQNAIKEFDFFVEKMRNAGIHITVVEDTVDPVKPDAVFPNNWITFHNDGSVVTYPMFSAIRRKERRSDVLSILKKDFSIKHRYQLENMEAENRFLEGTGSMIMDRTNEMVYACLSPRTDEGLLDIFCQMYDCEKVVFRSVDAAGEDIYHTNVMMALGETFVVICMDTIKNEAERNALLAAFEKTKKEVIEISFEQVLAFAGNMLQVRNKDDETILVMSQQAFDSLQPEQIHRIEQHTEILSSPIETIETFGGGSARCMMAEIFLPPKNSMPV